MMQNHCSIKFLKLLQTNQAIQDNKCVQASGDDKLQIAKEDVACIAFCRANIKAKRIGITKGV